MSKIFIIFLLLCSVALADNPYRTLNNMNAGELSPLLNAREDLAKYQSGCSIMENFIPIPQGGAEKRPGTKYIAEVKTSLLATRLLPFEYSTEQSYIIEAGNQYMRFYTDGAQIQDGVGTDVLTDVDGGKLLAHWKLNETTATTAVNSDNSGTYDGTISVDAGTVTATGKVDTALDLDGQYDVTVADNDVFSFTNNTADDTFSLMCWVYIEQINDFQVLMSKWRDSVAASKPEWRLSLDQDRKVKLTLADSSTNLESDRVAQWKLDEDAANTEVHDDTTAGDYLDPHDGVSTADTDVLAVTGKLDSSFDMDGQYYVTVADAADLSFGDGTNDSAFSISAWIYVEANGSDQVIITKYNHAGNREWFFKLEGSRDLTLRLDDDSVPSYLTATSTGGNLSDGWHFVTATYDGREGALANRGIKLYIDSELQISSYFENGTYVAMEDTAAVVVIGGYYNAAALAGLWESKLDNIAIYNTELTQGGINALWNNGTGTAITNAVEVSAQTDDALDVGWHFICSTYSAPTDETAAADGIILYVDGAAVDSTATNSAVYTAMQNDDEEVRLGSQRNSGDTANEKFLAERLDEVSIFDDVLTPTEVASLYSTTTFEIESPYLTADIPTIKIEQSADVLYLTHPSYETRELSRFGDTVWTLEVAGRDTGPFRSQNATVTKTITASATTGTVTLTATGGNVFATGSTAGHEPSGNVSTSKSQTGALFRIVHPLSPLEYSETLTDKYGAGGSTVENTSWMSLGTLYEGAGWTLTTMGVWTGTLEIQRNYTIGAAHGAAGWESIFDYASNEDRNVSTSGTAGADAGTAIQGGTETDGSADYRAILTASGDAAETCKVYWTTDQTEIVGIVEITSVTSPTVATGTVVKTLASTDATYKWSEGAWSNYRGWPRTVTFFEDRLMFGGNINQPDTIWGSVTGDYANMTAGPDDDEAVIFTLTSRQVNVIEWLVGKDKLLIGTSGGEWTIAGGTDEPLTPSNVIAKQHSTYGSANLQATLANESVLFFQRGSEKMRELAYNWELDSYVAPDMTILANTVTDTGITDTAFQRTPNSILWTTRTDGEMPIFSYERSENITAWSRMITQTNLAGTLADSDIESVAVINGDPEDEVWVIVERTIGGAVVRYIEQFQPRDFGDAEDAIFVDSCVTYDSTASSAMTGLGHLEGQTIHILGDGTEFDTEIVGVAGGFAAGAVTLSKSGVTTTASTVQMGLVYETQLRTMPLSWLGGATIHGKTKRISEVVTDWYKSGDFSIGRDADTLQTYSITGQTTSVERKTFPPGFDRNGYIYMYQKSPEPLTVLAVSAEFNVQ